TSMHDIPSEVAFVETCIEALSDSTIILITHRPASLALADRVLVASAKGYRTLDQAEVAGLLERPALDNVND
ncbi:MAG: hypothetical protein AAGA34_07140, partial [Pseudomonadota bacterium]